ncbi:hypothetical protein [Vibrio algivorus]|uniref:Uncharacterized protein n=1 Tax=Vibrio algivorus TaxID=1667024 RepID=A0A557P182_9VIBR|nr:hypothetical protein [Vibrio algivorus]TVO34411.1 hypothetical protein FOF44_13615 [Vibrio algivorus]GLT13399.1 hypothetical protein GCM10007931_03730 [Vibrio algivorus]
MLKTINKELALSSALMMRLFIVNFHLVSLFYLKGIFKKVFAVKSDIAANSIVADNPARVFKESKHE